MNTELQLKVNSGNKETGDVSQEPANLDKQLESGAGRGAGVCFLLAASHFSVSTDSSVQDGVYLLSTLVAEEPGVRGLPSPWLV